MRSDIDDADALDNDIKRMAEQRIWIEESMQERTDELEKIGDFGIARCTEFTYNDRGRRNQVEFTFKLPDGTIECVIHDISEEPRSFKHYLTNHGADSPTDMVGAKHACVYTDDGWRLWESQSVREWMHIQLVNQKGELYDINTPAVVAPFAVLVLLAVAAAITAGPVSFMSVLFAAVFGLPLLYVIFLNRFITIYQ